MRQTQNQTQLTTLMQEDFKRTGRKAGGLDPTPVNDVNWESIKTRAYFTLQYKNLKNDVTVCDKGLPCFFSFTNMCKTGQLLFSGFCEGHNQTLFNRTYITTTALGNETTIRPVPLDQAIAKTGFPLFSLLKVTDTHDSILTHLNSTGPNSTARYDNPSIAKFLATLATPNNTQIQDTTSLKVTGYITNYLQSVAPLLLSRNNIISRTLVTMTMHKDEFDNQYRSNFWFREIIMNNWVHSSNIENNEFLNFANIKGPIIMRIYLKYFLIPDILAIMGYSIIPMNIETTDSENISISENAFCLGTGAGLKSTILQQQNYLKATCHNVKYAPELRPLLQSACPLHVNYDICTVSAFYFPESTDDGTVPIPVTFATKENWAEINELGVTVTVQQNVSV